MSTPIPETTLPTDTDLGFSYEYGVDINLGTVEDPIWQRIRFISNVDPQTTNVTVDAQTYEDLGSANAIKTSESWTLPFFVQAHYKQDGSLIQEQAALKAYTEPDVVGEAATADVRWYDNPAERAFDPDEAYRGRATVQMVRAQTGPGGEVAGWNVTLTGRGRRTKITHPKTNP